MECSFSLSNSNVGPEYQRGGGSKGFLRPETGFATFLSQRRDSARHQEAKRQKTSVGDLESDASLRGWQRQEADKSTENIGLRFQIKVFL